MTTIPDTIYNSLEITGDESVIIYIVFITRFVNRKDESILSVQREDTLISAKN